MLREVFVSKVVKEWRSVYHFEDLKEDVQEKLVKEEQESNCTDPWFWDFIDFEDSYKAIADVLGAKLKYSYDTCSYSYTELLDCLDFDVAELKDSRAMAYIWNNWIEPNLKGKYYSTKGRWINGKYCYKHRYSKIKKSIDDCPFSGIFWDNVFADAWDEWKAEYKRRAGRSHVDVDDFVKILQDKMTDYVIQEAEYKESEEYAREHLMESDTLYYENGTEADVA